jgi:transcription elongation factor/antiterminator RfaH
MRTEYYDCCGSPSNWAVVNTHPHRENVAVDNLQRQAFHAYCPMVRRQRRHARRVSDVLRPLFPGYLFAQVNPESQRWRPMLSTLGVRNVVQCGDRLSLIEDAFVQSLKQREVDGAIARPEHPYQLGQEVRIAGGAFDGLVARIIEMDERDRLTVLMDLLSRPVKVKIDEQQISPI